MKRNRPELKLGAGVFRFLDSNMRSLLLYSVIVGSLLVAPSVYAQATERPAPGAQAASGVAVPGDYVIGAEDVLGILFWREADVSGDVTVRSDGMITLPLIGDVRAAGMRPDVFKEELAKISAKFLTEPNVTVVIKQINSRKVFITGEVKNPGAYPLTAPRTVMQLIAISGGLTEYADGNAISVLRTEAGKQKSYRFHYNDVARGKALAQNIVLLPGDTVVVP